MELAYPFFWEAVLLTIGLFEAARAQAGWNVPGRQSAVDQMKADYEPGNLGFDPLGLYPRDERAQYEIGTKEARRHPAASRLLPRPAGGRVADRLCGALVKGSLPPVRGGAGQQRAAGNGGDGWLRLPGGNPLWPLPRAPRHLGGPPGAPLRPRCGPPEQRDPLLRSVSRLTRTSSASSQQGRPLFDDLTHVAPGRARQERFHWGGSTGVRLMHEVGEKAASDVSTVHDVFSDVGEKAAGMAAAMGN